MEDFLVRPVRNLSLGERLKCELVAALLHRPELLFLDDPARAPAAVSYTPLNLPTIYSA